MIKQNFNYRFDSEFTMRKNTNKKIVQIIPLQTLIIISALNFWTIHNTEDVSKT